MPEAKPLHQLRAKRTRSQLLDAARTVFSRQGYAGTTVDDIAEAAGVSKGSFYFHFATKEDALLELISAWAEEVVRQIEPLPKRKATLNETIDGLLSTGGTTWKPALLLEFWTQAGHSPRVQEAVASAERAWRGTATKVLARAQSSGLLGPAATTESALSALVALRGGLIAQATLNSTAVSRRAGRRAVRALLEPTTARRRRAG